MKLACSSEELRFRETGRNFNVEIKIMSVPEQTFLSCCVLYVFGAAQNVYLRVQPACAAERDGEGQFKSVCEL